MNTDYEKLMEILKKYNEADGLKNVSFYTGNINGKYDTEYNIENKDVLDTIISDGDIRGSVGSYDVENASYVCVSRYKNNPEEKLSSKIEKIDLFIEKGEYSDLPFYMSQKDFDVYQKVFKQSNNKGDISQYENDDSKGLKIFPSKELIKDNLATARIRGKHT